IRKAVVKSFSKSSFDGALGLDVFAISMISFPNWSQSTAVWLKLTRKKESSKEISTKIWSSLISDWGKHLHLARFPS
ncbi:MAG: hypothetical protein V7703_02960, partial [Hyphomicrobiales bacterium]